MDIQIPKHCRGGGTNYFLAVGSSHTEGFHVKKNEKWTYLLETKLNKEVYNIAHSGYYFPAILKNFDCILNEFPYAEKIIIEVDNLLFPSEMIDKCSEQSKYDKSQSYEEIVKNLSTKEKIIHNIKLNVPLLRWLNFQYKTITSIEDYEEKTNDNYKEIIDSYDEIFKLIKSEYDKDIIVVYHPIEIIVNDNEIRFENSDFINLFSECCNTNGIIFIDMSNDFANDFRLNNILHHGFDNTTLGNGHLNKYGNKLIAESLYKFLGGRNE